MSLHEYQIILKGTFWLTEDLILPNFINCHGLTSGIGHKGNISSHKVSGCVGVLRLGSDSSRCLSEPASARPDLLVTQGGHI